MKAFEDQKEKCLEPLRFEKLAVDLLFSRLMEAVIDGIEDVVRAVLLALLREAVEYPQYRAAG
jgi:hypothetical protein